MEGRGREYLRRVGPLLLACAVGCTAAAAGLTNTLDEPAFEVLLHVMVIAAVGVSAVMGMLGRSSTVLGIIVIAVALAAVTPRLATAPGVDLLFPAEAVADEDLTLATLCAWLMVGFCFMLARRENVLLAMVAALAVFGLNATVNLNTVIIIDFAVFVFALIFVWGYEQLLKLGASIEGRERPRDWPGIARTQALATTMLVTVLLVLGLLVGTGLHVIGPRFYMGGADIARYARWLQRSLASYGGMLDTFEVGRGPVNLPHTPALAVRADRPALWRGAVYDFYTGQGWTRGREDRRELARGEDGWLTVPWADDRVGEINHQVVTFINMESRAMYAAATPIRVRTTEASWNRTRVRYAPRVDVYGSLYAQFRLVDGAEYEVISVMPPTDAETLRAAPATYSDAMVETYIEQVPVQAEAELAELVAEVTADAPTPYDRVEALRQFLGGTCTYSLRARAVPRGRDVAAYFVQTSRRGACDQFATALVVMSRLAGVPARIATGFQTGTYDREVDAYIVLQSDAHAWAEVFFPGVGWVPFDVSAGESDRGVDLWAMLRNVRWRREVTQVLETVGQIVLAVAAALALVSAVVGPGVLLRWLRGRTGSRSGRERMGEVFEWFRRRAAKLAGVKVQRWRTPAEVGAELREAGLARGPRVQKQLAGFTQRFYEHRYGRGEPDDQQVRQTRAEARSLLGELRRDLRTLGREGEGG